MSERPPEPHRTLYSRLLLRATLWAGGALFAFYVVPPLLSLFAPFIVAYLVAVVLNPVVSRVRINGRAPRKALAITLVTLVCIMLLTLIILAVRAAFGQAISLAANIPSILDGFQAAMRFVNERAEWLLNYMPPDARNALTGFAVNAYQWLRATLQSFFLSILASARPASMRIGSWALQSVFAIIAAYYFTAEYNLHGDWIKRRIGNRLYGKFRMVAGAVQAALGNYLKAQLLLSLVCFALMFPALALYGQRYAFLIALFLAILDFLPFFGAPAMLLPWGALTLLAGHTGQGIFLLALMSVFFMIRRVVEPKIMGGQAGLHPLVALVGIYVGIRLGGILGALLGPVLLMAAIGIYKAQVFEDAIEDLRSAGSDISRRLRRKS